MSGGGGESYELEPWKDTMMGMWLTGISALVEYALR